VEEGDLPAKAETRRDPESMKMRQGTEREKLCGDSTSWEDGEVAGGWRR